LLSSSKKVCCLSSRADRKQFSAQFESLQTGHFDDVLCGPARGWTAAILFLGESRERRIRSSAARYSKQDCLIFVDWIDFPRRDAEMRGPIEPIDRGI
jgi:hypothetical protein